MYVRECMTAAPVTIAPDATIADARQMLGLHGVRHLPVVERGRLLGMLSDRDVAISDIELRRAVRENAVDALVSDERTVRSIMSSDVHTIGEHASIGDAARLMVSRQINALPVVDDERALLGLVTSTDCLLTLLDSTTATRWPAASTPSARTSAGRGPSGPA